MYQDEPVETLEISENCTVELYPDWDMENPREEWDHAGLLFYKSRDYDFTDKGAELPLGSSRYHEASYRFAETFVEIMLHGVAIPVRFSDYGSNGARIYAMDADDANGIIWVSGETIKKEWSGDKAAARRCLLAEIDEFDSYLQGDVYGYVVKYQGEHIDSCWGFIGYKYALEEARSAGEAACEAEARNRREAARQGHPDGGVMNTVWSQEDRDVVSAALAGLRGLREWKHLCPGEAVDLDRAIEVAEGIAEELEVVS